jgi:hypothetical protein
MQQVDTDVSAYVASLSDEGQRQDAATLIALLRRITGHPPAMWGPGMIGFGSYHYRYASGREGDWFPVGFAPRKGKMTLYLMEGFAEYEALLQRLGKHSTGKGCLYLRRLADVDLGVLEEIVRQSVSRTPRS